MCLSPPRSQSRAGSSSRPRERNPPAQQHSSHLQLGQFRSREAANLSLTPPQNGFCTFNLLCTFNILRETTQIDAEFLLCTNRIFCPAVHNSTAAPVYH